MNTVQRREVAKVVDSRIAGNKEKYEEARKEALQVALKKARISSGVQALRDEKKQLRKKIENIDKDLKKLGDDKPYWRSWHNEDEPVEAMPGTKLWDELMKHTDNIVPKVDWARVREEILLKIWLTGDGMDEAMALLDSIPGGEEKE